jgi:hypothetical protein
MQHRDGGRSGTAIAALISQDNSCEMPTEEEAEASEQADLYEIVCAYIERMSDETRRRTFAHTDSGAAAIERPPRGWRRRDRAGANNAAMGGVQL